jgi:hypothetical protein
MDSERWRQIEELYDAALACERAERSALLDQAGPEVRREVELLLAQEGSLFDRPAWEGMPETTEVQVVAGRLVGRYEIEGQLGCMPTFSRRWCLWLWVVLRRPARRLPAPASCSRMSRNCWPYRGQWRRTREHSPARNSWRTMQCPSQEHVALASRLVLRRGSLRVVRQSR